MHVDWTLRLVIALLCSCSSQDSSDGVESDVSVDRAPETTAGIRDADSRIRYSSGICAIFEDSTGRFWFGSQREGACSYDGREFTYYTVRDGLSDNQVRKIQEDQAGVLWFGTGNGITSFDGGAFEIRTGPGRAIPADTSEDAWHKKPDDLWFPGDCTRGSGGDGQGVYRFDGRSLSYLALPLPHSVDPTNPHLVTSIAKGRDGTVWFGTYPGVFRHDGHPVLVIHDETAGVESGREKLHVRSMLEDSHGNLWIGNNGLGVLLYDGQSVSNFTEQHGLSIREKGASGSLGRVFSIAEDATGNIWFGTRDNGVWRFDGESLTNFTMEDGLTSHAVWTIYSDRRDVLWFGMSDGRVCRFNGESFDKIY